MRNDMILKINTILREKDNIKKRIDKDIQKDLNNYLISIILLLAEENGNNYLSYNLFF
jgi:hypothetical protein